jgi:hypothetical protein
VQFDGRWHGCAARSSVVRRCRCALGEIACRQLGCRVEARDDEGHGLTGKVGEVRRQLLLRGLINEDERAAYSYWSEPVTDFWNPTGVSVT